MIAEDNNKERVLAYLDNREIPSRPIKARNGSIEDINLKSNSS